MQEQWCVRGGLGRVKWRNDKKGEGAVILIPCTIEVAVKQFNYPETLNEIIEFLLTPSIVKLTKGAFTYYVSSRRGVRGFGLVLILFKIG